MNAIRSALENLDKTKCSNPALLASRFLRIPVGEDNDSSVKKELYEAMRVSVKNEELRKLYGFAYNRWERWVKNAPAVCFKILSTKGRMIAGLGGQNVLETGITLHPVYGVPFIPGSSLKGVAAHYCSEVLGKGSEEYRAEIVLEKDKKGREHERILSCGRAFSEIFGTTADKEDNRRGCIVFHDAWITPDTLHGSLLHDVMTPHHMAYNGGPGGKDFAPPTDFDDPNPVAFLSVTGSFLLSVSCEDPSERGKKWAQRAIEILLGAIRDWGIGGKTSSGYGRIDERQFSGLKYKKGDNIAVIRIDDTKKGKPQFQADDGGTGGVLEAIPQLPEIGGAINLFVLRTEGRRGYTFQMHKP